jgi:hypothetical protein
LGQKTNIEREKRGEIPRDSQRLPCCVHENTSTLRRFGLSRSAGLYCELMAKHTDEELLKRLEEKAPEVLRAKVNFDALAGKVLVAGSVDIDRAPKRHRSTKIKKHNKKA